MGACMCHPAGNDAPSRGHQACTVTLTVQPEGSSKGSSKVSSKGSSKRGQVLDASFHHYIQQAAGVSAIQQQEELTQLLELTLQQLGCWSAQLVWWTQDDADVPWLHAFAPVSARQHLQEVVQECRRNAGKIILHQPVVGNSMLTFSAAPIKAVHSSQTHGCLFVMHQVDSSNSTAGCRTESCAARMLFTLGDMALRVLERHAHLANRLSAEGLPVPPALMRMGLPACANEAPSKHKVVDAAAVSAGMVPNLPQNVLMMSGVRRQMQDKQDVLHACSLIIDTGKAGWPVLYTADTWVLWSGLKRSDTVGLPLQSLLKKAKLSAASLRWPELELSAARGHSFVLCDVALSLSGVSDSLVSSSAYNIDAPNEDVLDMEGLLQQLIQHEKQSQAAGVWDSSLPDLKGIRCVVSAGKKAQAPAAGALPPDPLSLTDSQAGSGSWAHSSTRPLAATWSESELQDEATPCTCLGPRFDLCFKPLATTTLDQVITAPGDVPKPCAGPLAGLYEVQIFAQGVLPLPEEMLQATATVDDPDDLSLGDLAECFWPGLEVGRKLGAGGFGSVYQGVWHNVRVAIKVQDFQITTPRQLAEAQLEVLLGQQLGHPNLVQTLSHAVVELKQPEPIQFLSMTSSWLQLETKGTCSSTRLSPMATLAQPAAASPSVTTRAARPPTLRCLQLLEHCNAGTFQDGIDKGWLKLPDCCDSASSVTAADPAHGSASWRQEVCMDNFKVLCVAHDICACLHYLHTQGLAHADVSAGNVLLNISGPREADMKLASAEMHVAHVELMKSRPQLAHHPGHARPWLRAKISDLGAARFTGSGNGSVPARCFGTPTHMAPEVLTHQEVSQASDVYSLGVLLWQICHQLPACPGMSYPDVMRAIAAQKVPTWKASVGLSAELAALGRKCCAADPSARPTSLEALTCIRGLMAAAGRLWVAVEDHPPAALAT